MTDPGPSSAVAPRWSARALLLAWSVPVALAMPLVLRSQPPGETVALWRIVLIVAASWYSWAFMTPAIVRLAERRRLERPLAIGTVTLHLGAAVAGCTVQALSIAVATQLLAPPPNATIVGVFLYWWLLVLPAGVVVYAAVVGLRTAELNRAEIVARERQAAALMAQLAEAQLKALRAQIQPHFLFNTLNAVIALVRDRETEQAVNALTTLSALLRTALRTGASHEVSFAEELAFTTNYLAIEQMRFGNRLAVRMNVPTELRDVFVPSFLLQPFVENAVRHGLRRQRNGGHVDISARAEARQLVVRVEDNGAGLSADWLERCASGFGVANSRARLDQLYGPNASLRIAPRGSLGGTAVEIALPLRRATAEQGVRVPA